MLNFEGDMDSLPLVSVIMPSYNSEKTILDSVNSVLGQSYENWELIIVDDCSTDHTFNVIKPLLSDKRITFWSLAENSGSPAEPRNFGLDIAKGSYIAFLDSDDIWYRDKLEFQINFMIENNYVISCSPYDIINREGKKISDFFPPSCAEYKNLITNNSIGCLTLIVKADKLQSDRFPNCGHEDFALWLKLSKRLGPIYSCGRVLAAYRRMDDSVSSNKLRVISFYWNIYRTQELFSIGKSLTLMFLVFYKVAVVKYMFRQ